MRSDGSAHMVDVSGKPPTRREAVAAATFISTHEVISRIIQGDLPKGEALSVARVAGIMAAKQTSTLVPLCHPLPISKVEVDFEASDDQILIRATVATTGPTGVEMEALTAVSVAALTLYDMVKALDRTASINDIRVLSKVGGTHDFTADER